MGYVAVKDMQAGHIFSGAEVYIKSFETKPMQKKKQDFGTGFIEDTTGTLSYKVWESDVVELMKSAKVQGKVLSVDGECAFSTYSNCLELKITKVNGEVVDADMDKYVRTCDIEGNRAEFNALVNKHLSQKYAQALMTVLSQPLNKEGKDNLFSKFKVEQAAHSVHDALKGGLLNHTLKMCRLVITLIENDKRLEAYKDILVTGTILHDIGKVYEYDKGEKTKVGFVTHHVLGVEIVSKVKEQVVALIGEDAYYRVLSIIQGHHGEFGDRPTSIYAYVIHLIDMVDAKTTSIIESIDSKTNLASYGGNDVVKIDGYNLVV